MKSTLVLYSTLVAFVLLCPRVDAALEHGRVIDAVTKQPIEGAFVTSQDIAVRTDANGVFHIDGKGDQIGVRAYGYRDGGLTPTNRNRSDRISNLHPSGQRLFICPSSVSAIALCGNQRST